MSMDNIDFNDLAAVCMAGPQVLDVLNLRKIFDELYDPISQKLNINFVERCGDSKKEEDVCKGFKTLLCNEFDIKSVWRRRKVFKRGQNIKSIQIYII